MLGVGHCTGEGWHLYLQPLSCAGPLNDFNLLVLTRLSAEERRRRHHKPFKSPRHVGDASRFDEHDALFREGHFKAGAPSAIWEWFHGERSSVSDALPTGARRVPGQAAQPRWTVRVWRAGEVGWPRLSGGRGEVWTRWGCLNIDDGFARKIYAAVAYWVLQIEAIWQDEASACMRRPIRWPHNTFSSDAKCFTSIRCVWLPKFYLREAYFLVCLG